MKHDWKEFTDGLAALLKTSGDSGVTGDRVANSLKPPLLSVTTRRAEASPVANRVVIGLQTSGDAFVESKQLLAAGVTSVTTVTTQFARGNDEAKRDEEAPRSGHTPGGWRDGFRTLRDAEPLIDFSPIAWDDMLADAATFLREWGDTAVTLGWSKLDVFGVHPVKPAPRVGCWGLALFIQGGRVVAITDSSATIRRQSGAVLVWRRHDYGTERVPLWRLVEKGEAR
jgi:hypothetical protein